MPGDFLSQDFETWFSNPCDETRMTLMGRCEEWVDDVVHRLSPSVRADTRRATLAHIEEKLTESDGNLFSLTDGVMADGAPQVVTGVLEPVDEKILYRTTGFLSFILALTNYFAVRNAGTRVDRREAGRALLEALSLPIAHSAGSWLKDHWQLPEVQLELAIDRVKVSLSEPSDAAKEKGQVDSRLLRDWVRKGVPETFGQTVALVRVAAKRAASDVIQLSQNKDLTDTIVSLNRDETPEPTATAWCSPCLDRTPGLVDYLLPVCCRVAAEFPTDRGAHLFPWLVLGGVSKDNREKSWTDVPHMKQPDLISALQSVVGRNCIRNIYEPKVSQLMKMHGVFDAMKQWLADLNSETSGSADPQNMIDHADTNVDDLVEAARRNGLIPDVTRTAQIPPRVFWQLFGTVGRETARQIQDGALLNSSSLHIPEMAISGGVLGVIGWLRGLEWEQLAHGNEPLDRELLAQAAKWICEQHNSVGDWEICLRSI